VNSWNAANPEKYAANRLNSKLKLYKLSKYQYEELLLKQDFKCAICSRHQNETDKSLSIDHDHNTGKIRGLLCHNCNLAVGHLKDDPVLAIKASEYLKKFSV